MDPMEELFFDSTCPHCRRTVTFPGTAAGLALDCPQCDEILVVPKAEGAPAGKLPLPITTARLRLRPFTTGDAPQLAEFMCDPELFEYLEEWLLAPEDVEAAVARMASHRLTRGAGAMYLAIEADGQVVGLVGLNFTDRERLQGLVHAIVGPEFQGRGIGTEALRALLGFAFVGISLHRITATCDSRQTAACRMLEKAGLRREGEFFQDRRVGGEWADTVSYAMLATEFG